MARSEAPGVINMHWTFPKGKGMGGRPFSTLVDFMKSSTLQRTAGNNQRYLLLHIDAS